MASFIPVSYAVPVNIPKCVGTVPEPARSDSSGPVLSSRLSAFNSADVLSDQAHTLVEVPRVDSRKFDESLRYRWNVEFSNLTIWDIVCHWGGAGTNAEVFRITRPDQLTWGAFH